MLKFELLNQMALEATDPQIRRNSRDADKDRDKKVSVSERASFRADKMGDYLQDYWRYVTQALTPIQNGLQASYSLRRMQEAARSRVDSNAKDDPTVMSIREKQKVILEDVEKYVMGKVDISDVDQNATAEVSFQDLNNAVRNLPRAFNFIHRDLRTANRKPDSKNIEILQDRVATFLDVIDMIFKVTQEYMNGAPNYDQLESLAQRAKGHANQGQISRYQSTIDDAKTIIGQCQVNLTKSELRKMPNMTTHVAVEGALATGAKFVLGAAAVTVGLTLPLYGIKYVANKYGKKPEKRDMNDDANHDVASAKKASQDIKLKQKQNEAAFNRRLRSLEAISMKKLGEYIKSHNDGYYSKSEQWPTTVASIRKFEKDKGIKFSQEYIYFMTEVGYCRYEMGCIYPPEQLYNYFTYHFGTFNVNAAAHTLTIIGDYGYYEGGTILQDRDGAIWHGIWGDNDEDHYFQILEPVRGMASLTMFLADQIFYNQSPEEIDAIMNS